MKYLSEEEARSLACREVFSVEEFCERQKLDEIDSKRLRRLLGSFATQHELQMNMQRRPSFR